MKVKVNLLNKSGYKFAEREFDELAAAILAEELEDMDTEPELEIGLLLSVGETIRELNRRYRGVDRKTDVLSFSGDYPNMPQLGDIIIDIEKAIEQKGIMTLSFEAQKLFIHGLLHLLGYDHLSLLQSGLMHSKEARYQKYIKEKGSQSGR